MRRAVRILLVDPEERVLLFGATDPDTGERFWFPPGGGLEDGEDVHAAAARELSEETGLTDVALGPEVWRRRHVFRWRGAEHDQREHWFLARVPRFSADGSRMTAQEQAELTPARWWSLDELAGATERLVPADLAARLPALLRDGPPPAPVEVGT